MTRKFGPAGYWGFVFATTAFVSFSFLVDLGTFRSFDYRVAFWLKAHVSGFLSWFFAIVCRTGNAEITVPAGILLVAWGLAKKRGNAAFGGLWILWLLVGVVLEHVLKHRLVQPHPTQAVLNDPLEGFELIPIHLPLPPGSYPSGHTFRAVWMVFLVGEFVPGWSRWIRLWALSVIAGVISLGWHWTTDTLGAVLFALMGMALIGRYRRS